MLVLVFLDNNMNNNVSTIIVCVPPLLDSFQLSFVLCVGPPDLMSRMASSSLQ